MMDEHKITLLVDGLDMPVQEGPGRSEDGISIGQDGRHVCVVITRDGRQLSVWLAADALDYVAGLLADCITAATRAQAPSLETVQ
jgi:hypothetical protein